MSEQGGSGTTVEKIGNPVIYMTEDIIDRLFEDVFPGGTFVPDSYRYEINVPD